MNSFIPRYRIYSPWELVAVILFDLLTNIIFIPLKLIHVFRKKSLRDYSPDKVKKILVFRTDRMGDFIMTLPALRQLEKRYNGSDITYVTGSWNRVIAEHSSVKGRMVYRNPSWISRGEGSESFFSLCRFALSLRRERYDLALDFTSDIRINILMFLSGARKRLGYNDGGGGALLTDRAEELGLHRVEQNLVLLRRLNIDFTETSLEGYVTPPKSSSEDLKRLLKSYVSSPAQRFILLHPWGGRPVKTWSPERYIELIRMLKKEYSELDIFITGAEGEKKFCDKIAEEAGIVSLAGKVSLREMMVLLDGCELFISPDTGPMHLAVAMGVNTVTLFGPSDVVKYAPRGPGEKHPVVEAVDMSCLHCNKIRKPPAKCIKDGVSVCMRAITPGMVLAACRKILEKK